MRPTQIRMGEMPGPKVYATWWGDNSLQHQKGITQYSRSPFRERAGKNMFRNYAFNFYRRVAPQTPYILIPFGFIYGIFSWAHSYDQWQNSKAGHMALHGVESEGGH